MKRQSKIVEIWSSDVVSMRRVSRLAWPAAACLALHPLPFASYLQHEYDSMSAFTGPLLCLGYSILIAQVRDGCLQSFELNEMQGNFTS